MKGFAFRKSLEINGYDVSTLNGRLQASVRNTKKTSTVIIGRNRTEDQDDLKELESKLVRN